MRFGKGARGIVSLPPQCSAPGTRGTAAKGAEPPLYLGAGGGVQGGTGGSVGKGEEERGGQG